MVKRATLGMFVMLLMCSLVGLNWLAAEAQTATPSQGVITVSGVPAGTTGLAVETTVDTAFITLGSASSSVSGALVVTGSMSEGVGIISTSGDLPASFTITVPFTGVAAGTSMVSVGNVLNMLGGTAIAGASAMIDVSSVTVGASTSSSSSSSSSGSTGAGGMLSADTITITVDGTAVNSTNALNLTVAFTDSSVVSLDTGVTFMGTGATQLLTDVNATTGLITAVWDGTITDGKAVITAMLKAGSMAGSTMIGVSKVEAAGGTDITSSVVATVNPDSVENTSTSTTDVGTFTLVGPTTVQAPGNAAIGFKTAGTPSGITATLNGAMVDFGVSGVGVAIVDLSSAMGSLPLSLVVTASGMSTTVDLGSVTVTSGSGKAPRVTSANVRNKFKKTTLLIAGRNFAKTVDETTLTIVPTNHTASIVRPTSRSIKAQYTPSECIPNGSFINVSTPGGTSARKLKLLQPGNCANPLVP